MEPSDVIVLEDLVVGFGNHTVIDKLSLSIRSGETLGLIGASGGGKSVLMRAVIGLIKKQGGTIRIHTHGGRPPESQIGVLFQQGALFSSLTARQNVQFPLRENVRLSEEFLNEFADAKLEMVGLTAKDGNKFPAELSGGMTKRVALARALALDPTILFLDEPTSGLDPIAAGDFDALINVLKRTVGFTVFMVTHDLSSLASVCDRVAALADGRIVALGSLVEVRASDHPWVRSYFHGSRAEMMHLSAAG